MVVFILCKKRLKYAKRGIFDIRIIARLSVKEYTNEVLKIMNLHYEITETHSLESVELFRRIH